MGVSAYCLGSWKRSVVALALVAAGCATDRTRRVSWPAAPATERIRLVRTFSNSTDLEGSFPRFWRNWRT